MTPTPALQVMLPVSRQMVTLRLPTGRDEMLLLEMRGHDAWRACAFVSQLEGGALDVPALPVHDLDALLLRLRQALIGDRILAETRCGGQDCRAPVDVSFDIGAYLAHHAPRASRARHARVMPCSDAPGWFALQRTAPAGEAPARFRLPTIGDELDLAGQHDAAVQLAARCLPSVDCPAGLRRVAEGAMAVLAPPLAGPVSGTCPECASAVVAHFDPRRYVLAELRSRAFSVTDDLDVLARNYHWTERAILQLPSQRRAAYAEMARRAA